MSTRTHTSRYDVDSFLLRDDNERVRRYAWSAAASVALHAAGAFAHDSLRIALSWSA